MNNNDYDYADDDDESATNYGTTTTNQPTQQIKLRWNKGCNRKSCSSLPGILSLKIPIRGWQWKWWENCRHGAITVGVSGVQIMMLLPHEKGVNNDRTRNTISRDPTIYGKDDCQQDSVHYEPAAQEVLNPYFLSLACGREMDCIDLSW